jgi:hypothetical protein
MYADQVRPDEDAAVPRLYVESLEARQIIMMGTQSRVLQTQGPSLLRQTLVWRVCEPDTAA